MEISAPVPVSSHSYLYVDCNGEETNVANCQVYNNRIATNVTALTQIYVLCGKGNFVILEVKI